MMNMDKKTVILHGGFECRLTEDERNQWAEHTKDSPELLEYVTAGGCAANVVKHRGPTIPTAIERAVERCVAAGSAMFVMGREWYATVEKARAEAEKPE